MLKIKDLKVGQTVFYLEEELDAKYCNLDFVLRTKPFIIQELIKDQYTNMDTYRIRLQQEDYCFSIVTFKTCKLLFATKKDLIKSYIHACNKYIKPVYEQLQLAKKYLEDTKECLQ